jgi:hypothetical protein
MIPFNQILNYMKNKKNHSNYVSVGQLVVIDVNPWIPRDVAEKDG